VGSIEASPHKHEIFSKLLSGWSPARIAASLLSKYGAEASPSDIRAFAAEIPPETWLKPSALAQRLKYVDIEIDPIQEMHKLIAFQRERLDDVLLLEKAQGQQQNTLVNDRAKALWKMLCDYVKLMGELGMLPERREIVREEQAIGMTVKELIERRRTSIEITRPPAKEVVEPITAKAKLIEAGTTEG
jgi:hypothetical protein